MFLLKKRKNEHKLLIFVLEADFVNPHVRADLFYGKIKNNENDTF